MCIANVLKSLIVQKNKNIQIKKLPLSKRKKKLFKIRYKPYTKEMYLKKTCNQKFHIVSKTQPQKITNFLSLNATKKETSLNTSVVLFFSQQANNYYQTLFSNKSQDQSLQQVKKYIYKPINLSENYCYWPLQSFFEVKRFTVITQNLYSLIPLDKFNILVKQALSLFPFLKLNRIATQLIAALQLMLLFKDCSSFTRFIVMIFQEVHYSEHNKYFHFAHYIVNYIIGPQLKTFNCLGIRVVFRGKLGVGGNSRKSSHKLYYGLSSSSSKFVKLNKTYQQIQTKTGAVGLVCILAW